MMAFLKKHYEKIILAVFLLVFIFSLIWLITVLRTSLNIRPQDLKLPVIKPDYQQAVMYYYEITSNFVDDKPWEKTVKEDDKPKTDFMIPFEAARCDKCNKIIPFASYRAGVCPICDAKLVIMDKPSTRENDTDRDGMPDVWEKEYKLDWNNPDDAYTDLDKEGFPNLCEYKLGTDPTDPKSHPPAAIKLYICKVERKELPIKLERIVQRGGDDKKQWEIQIYFKIKGLWKLKFFKLNEVLLLGNESYKIIDIVPKTVKTSMKELKGAEIIEDASEIILQKEGDTPIVAQLNQPIYKTAEEINLKDCYTGKLYVAVLNKSLTVEVPGADSETYTVCYTDTKSKEKIVKIKDKDGKEFKITERDPAIAIGCKPKAEIEEPLPGVGTVPGAAPKTKPSSPAAVPGHIPVIPGHMPGSSVMPLPPQRH